DTHSELDPLAQSAAECVDDLCAQMAFDLVLDEAARHGQQRETFGDREGFDKWQPGPLLRGERGSGGVRGGQVWTVGTIAVEFGDDRVPYGRERCTGVCCQRREPPFSSVEGRQIKTMTSCPHSYPQGVDRTAS